MFKKIFGLLMIAGFALGLAPRSAAAAGSWNAEYWNNRDLSGSPAFGWKEDAIDHDWGDGTPHSSLNKDAFSARWTRTENFAPGTYRFTATTDDGMRVWVDGSKIIDSWYDSQVHTVSADVYLNGGNHTVKVEYYEAGGKAVAKMNWTLISGGGATWTAEYFNNVSLSGSPAVSRQEGAIDYVWHGSPLSGVNADQFSTRWRGSIPVDSGVYRLTVTADDGVRLWVNNRLVVDAWKEQPATAYVVDVTTSGGTLPVQVEYYEAGGQGVAKLVWTKVSGPPTTPTTPTITHWRGEYFNNIDLSGAPVLVRNDAAIDFSWGTSSPAPNVINADLFSARWTRTMNLARGNYTISATADDGIRVWVNDQLVIDRWRVQNQTTYTVDVFVPGGATTLRVEQFEMTGLATARVTIGNTGTGSSGDGIVPQAAVMRGAAFLNVRRGPGIAFEAFAHLRNGETVTLVGRDRFNFWIKIRLSDGREGWASSRYLRSDAPFANLPTVD